MTENKVRHCTLTKYPKIFAGTYWGNGMLKISQDIANNRNTFVEEYHIKSACHSPPKYVRMHIYVGSSGEYIYNDMDHIEVYKTHHKNYIVISSPYAPTRSDEYYDIHGWIKIYNLYYHDADTYMKHIPKK
jgi:hypothetical protein